MYESYLLSIKKRKNLMNKTSELFKKIEIKLLLREQNISGKRTKSNHNYKAQLSSLTTALTTQIQLTQEVRMTLAVP